MQNAQTHCGSRCRRVFLTSGAATGILSSIPVTVADVHPFSHCRPPRIVVAVGLDGFSFLWAQPQTPHPSSLPPLGTAPGTHAHLLSHPLAQPLNTSPIFPHPFSLTPLKQLSLWTFSHTTGRSHKHPHTFPLAPLGAPQATCLAFPEPSGWPNVRNRCGTTDEGDMEGTLRGL